MEGSSSSVGLDLYREGEYNSGEPQLQGSMSVPIEQAGGSAGVGAGGRGWPVLLCPSCITVYTTSMQYRCVLCSVQSSVL